MKFCSHPKCSHVWGFCGGFVFLCLGCGRFQAWSDNTSCCFFCFAVSLLVKGVPKFFLATCFFGGQGYRGQTTTPFQEHNRLWALPPEAARPNNQYFPKDVWFFFALVPQASKNHLATKLLQDSFELGVPLFLTLFVLHLGGAAISR